MREVITLKAPAKINLTLEVVGRLPNGYHTIRSVFVRLDKLSDTIELRITRSETGITLSTTSKDIPTDKTNICHRAAAAYFAATGETAGVAIHIEKNIPVAAGMGGGSSDAASVFVGLNNYFKAMSPRKLEALGGDIGKDVPFFIRGAAVCRVSGMGEGITPLRSFPRMHFLIVHPGIAISTADAYRALGQRVWFMSNAARADISSAMARAVRARDVGKIAATLFNDFEACMEHAHPVIKEIKQALLAFGARGALMTGSGSAVFGIYASRKALLNAERILKTHYADYVIASA
ncbi:MAG: 4-(cytidine 5'-diphospho)-2-C-methyl-D-erythritol kinase [Betaproteobacteria bacterium]|nr:4-(cytidine 5'-diphospho)-2-C-methyl-D-erythritol kinase [Betaproteobacteria bacterium]